MKKIFIIILFIAAASLQSCQETPAVTSEEKSETTELTVPVLETLDGKPFGMEQYQGKTVFLNFWATWCKPCVREMPSIQKLQQLVDKDNVVFLFATEDSPEEVADFQQEHAFPFTFIRVKNLEALGIEALPTTWIYSSQGDLQFSEAGFRKWDSPESVDLLRNIANANL